LSHAHEKHGPKILRRLPASVQEIADVIGRERALYLIGRLPRCYPPSGGGREQVIMYVPKRLKPLHRLVQILGWKDAERLVQVFGGEILKPGNCREIYRSHRDDGIVRAAQDGVPVAWIAQWFSVSTRHVQNVLRENAQEDDGALARNTRTSR
jgi:hypothetical protein